MAYRTQTPDIPQDQVNLTYEALPTFENFHACNDFVRGVMGPVGGGKTVGCIMELYTRAIEQKPHFGVRRSRWALIRNTYPDLISTTLNTFRDWIPDAICPVKLSAPIGGTLRINLEDGTRVEAEFLFLALDQEDDVRKLKSLELTGAFINEASEIRKSVLDMLTSRIPRYPSKTMGGASWYGIIMDTNPPADDHWWYKMAEVEKPRNYRFWKQPPALIKKVPEKGDPYYVPNDGTHGVPAAENVINHAIGFDYWLNMVGGKDPEWIKVFVLGEYGSIFTGRLVYHEYSDSVHLAKEDMEPYRGLPLILGWDFGLTPACVIGQVTPRGQLRVLDELVSEDMGIERFARDVVSPHLTKDFHGMPVYSVGDPAGAARSQPTEVSCFHMLELQGFPTEMAPTNTFLPRREAVAWFLTKLTDGEPGFLLNPRCQVLRKGFLGGYHYRRMQVSGSDRFAESPDKNEFSHIHDALQYACLFARRASLAGAPEGLPGRQRRRVTHKKVNGWT